jgi:hypothetical protein
VAQSYVYTAEGRKRKTLYGKTRNEVSGKLTKAMSDRDGGLLLRARTSDSLEKRLLRRRPYFHISAQKGNSANFALRPAIKSGPVGTCEALAQ